MNEYEFWEKAKKAFDEWRDALDSASIGFFISDMESLFEDWEEGKDDE